MDPIVSDEPTTPLETATPDAIDNEALLAAEFEEVFAMFFFTDIVFEMIQENEE